LAVKVWFWYFGADSDNGLSLPRVVQCPITYEDKDLNNIDDLWDMIELICNNTPDEYTIGQNLYFLLPLICNPKDILWGQDIINEYNWSKEYNLPPARTLDEMDYNKLLYYSTISMELAGIRKYENGKQ
jgi:hypothetical protein